MALLPVILFWTCKDEHSNVSARNRNRSGMIDTSDRLRFN